MTVSEMGIWRGHEPLILASQSSARQSLLTGAGIPFDAVPAAIDERAIQQASGLTSAGMVATHLAHVKAAFVAARYPGRIVIGADQTLALGERLFSKPGGRCTATEQLLALSGHTHELHSAVGAVCDGVTLFETIAVAKMTMRRLDRDSIEAYLDVAGEAVTTSVGAYQLEGLGIHLFDRIEGDHSTILGLPLLPLLAFLRGRGLLAI